MSRCWIAAAVVAGLGCDQAPGAAINVTVTTDITAATWLEVRVLPSGGNPTTSWNQRPWPAGSEQTFNFVPRGGNVAASPEAAFELVAGGCAPEGGRIPDRCVLVTRRVRAPYVAGSIVSLRLRLEDACREVPCPLGSTCVSGLCVDERTTSGVDAGSASSDVGRDAGATPIDLGSDVGTDMPGASDTPADQPTATCDDTDRDGLSDTIEGAPTQDTDGDGTPDFRDADSDNDGFPDDVEARRAYPDFGNMAQAVTCGAEGNNCDDSDALPNHRDLDSDDDGLTDREEFAAGTNPCDDDTDDDGALDLVESVAMSDGRSRDSLPPTSSLYVVLPYRAATPTEPDEFREFTFATRLRRADVFFLVDNSASLEPTIATLRSNLSSVIVPGVRAAIPDVRMGVGSFDSMPDAPAGSPLTPQDDGQAGSPGDYTLWMRQPLTTDAALVQTAFDGMRTIAQDTMGRYLGGNTAECQVTAMYEVLTGAGTRSGGYATSPASLRSVRNALDPLGNGWVATSDPARDCPGIAGAYGWGCFQTGRVPIMVLFSDAAWFDGPAPTSLVSNRGWRNAELTAAMTMRGAYFVGVDVSSRGTTGATYANATYLATATGTLNAMRSAVVFAPASTGGLGSTASGIVTAIATLANEARQDISTVVEPDTAETRLPTGRTTSSFVRAVTAVRGEPEMPTGYDRRDTRGFYGVLPSTRVAFRVDFRNDFVEGSDSARVFQAAIVVHGRAGSEVDRRPVFIVVPARGGS